MPTRKRRRLSVTVRPTRPSEAEEGGEAKEKKILATFIPEAWIRDNATEVDGRTKVDVTKAILRMGKEKALGIQDNDYDSDALAQEAGLTKHHSGPFRVEVERAIREYFGVGE